MSAPSPSAEADDPHARSPASVESAAKFALEDAASLVRHPFGRRYRRRSGPPLASEFDRQAALLALLAQNLGLTLAAPTAVQRQRGDLPSYATNAGLLLRHIALPDDWHSHDYGPLLGTHDNGQPIALVPGLGGYRGTTDPAVSPTRLGRDRLASVANAAYAVLPQLPEPLRSPWQLARYGLRGNTGWLSLSLVVSTVVGLLAMIGPLVMRALWDVAVPTVDYSLLAGLLVFTVANAVAATILRLLGKFASLRVEARYESFVRPAVWFRLTRVRAEYFSSHSIGELAQRVDLVPQLFGITIKPAISLVSLITLGVPALAMMVYLSWQLAAVAVVLVLVPLGLSTFVAWRSALLIKQDLQVSADVQARVHALLAGVGTLQVNGAESFGLKWWAQAYLRRQHLAVRMRHLEMAVSAFSMAWPIVVTAAIYWSVGSWLLGEISVGTYLAFMSAYGFFKSAISRIPLTVGVLFTLDRVWQLCRDVFQAPLERPLGAVDPGVLSGAVAMSRVTFAYPGGADVLRDVTLHVQPGEYLAIVGPSGSGKSTIVAMLLGLLTPDRGSITYDDVDFATLDVDLVRAQMGVMIQNMKPVGRDVRTVVSGDHQLTDAQVWQALADAQLADTVRKMPMGLATYLDDDTATLSGGEVQRLLLARALAGQPRILVMDEATAALDAVASSAVADVIAQRGITRIVVAHRLSTIAQADRVLVVDSGTIVQDGAPAELLELPGPFAELMAAQLQR